MRKGAYFILAFLAWGRVAAEGQLHLGVEMARSQYLLHEPVVVGVQVSNRSSKPLVFNNEEESWLQFIVTRRDGMPVRKDQWAPFPPLTLAPGESRFIGVNLTPRYALRVPGPYQVRAVLTAKGKQDWVSEPCIFHVQPGREMWKEERIVQGQMRRFSLLCFSPTLDSSHLYLRVEDEKNNLMYTTLSLGEITWVKNPEIFFDAEGELHILHTVGRALYHYSRATSQGQLVQQSLYVSQPPHSPHLYQHPDGSVFVQGGQSTGEAPWLSAYLPKAERP